MKFEISKEPLFAHKRSNAKLRQNLSKTEQTVKMNFVGVLLDLKSENLKLGKCRQNPGACCIKFADTDNVVWSYGISNSEEKKSVSGQQTHKLVSPSLEAILGTKNQNKKIQGSCYRGKITQKFNVSTFL